jgi:hypothetical protein
VAARVTYLDEEPAGLGAMLGGLIQANLEQNPEREALLKPAVIGIIADDAGVAITLRITPSEVAVANGLSGGRKDLLIRTNGEDLIGLSAVPLRFGLPDTFTKEGREVTGKLIRGKLSVKGMFRHLGVLTRLNRLISVA